ncbi:Uu.00g019550.m01.CDS01 [Anthostomella pinea]|uniref:Uu.00g019550.m01.CDS01 n=1 Tax=Anthostomella pinea TaxID=933095 RepID=A0AAI8YQU2_9PEZI|nr:Uu.00g019550.m01.CDS01 [Anthostomella pinea]
MRVQQLLSFGLLLASCTARSTAPLGHKPRDSSSKKTFGTKAECIESQCHNGDWFMTVREDFITHLKEREVDESSLFSAEMDANIKKWGNPEPASYDETESASDDVFEYTGADYCTYRWNGKDMDWDFMGFWDENWIFYEVNKDENGNTVYTPAGWQGADNKFHKMNEVPPEAKRIKNSEFGWSVPKLDTKSSVLENTAKNREDLKKKGYVKYATFRDKKDRKGGIMWRNKKDIKDKVYMYSPKGRSKAAKAPLHCITT